jgi:alkylation response protein AidB-like acyl-CoA dehydrogenase
LNIDDTYQEYVEAAAAAFRQSGGIDALRRLEWSSGASIDDEQWLTTFAALFEAQGRTLAVTPALSELMAFHYGLAGFQVAATSSQTVQGATAALCLNGPDREVPVAVTVDGKGIVELTGAVKAGAVDDPLDTDLVSWLYGVPSRTVLLDEDGARSAAAKAIAIARVAIAHEILGASTALMEIAVQYAKDRIQFDRPVGSFQAVQHLLAEAEVERQALRAACRSTLGAATFEVDVNSDALYLKALAGRCGRRIAQATLQSLGAIGFTWEHDHHRYLRRIMTLDALFGGVDELRPRLVIMDPRDRLWRTPAL